MGTARRRPRMEDCLPSDALETIMGYLDRDTLRTARLVSRTFCAAASAHIRSLTLENTFSVSVHRFPRLEHVALHYKVDEDEDEDGAEESLAEIDPRLRDLITSFRAGIEAPVAEILSQVALMPKLRSLEVGGYMEHGAALLRCCAHLEALHLSVCSMSVAAGFLEMTHLTSVRIDGVCKDGAADVSWLQHATNLRNLQALGIDISDGALPLIGNLTGLTGLTMSDVEKENDSLAPLIRLTRLRSLDISWELSETNLGMACSLASGSLLSLRVVVDREASADCGRFLSRQTALTELVVFGWQLCDFRHIRTLRVELLQSLKLYGPVQLDGEGISAPCKATSLTKLVIIAGNEQTYLGLSQALPQLTRLLSLELRLPGGGATQPHVGLSLALARLTHLRSLDLSLWCERVDTKILNVPMAVSPLTGLTRLDIAWSGVDNEDMRALLGLTNLRKLKLFDCPVTDDVVRELGVLTNLHTLEARRCEVRSLRPVREIVGPLREARGLQPMCTVVRPCEGRLGIYPWPFL